MDYYSDTQYKIYHKKRMEELEMEREIDDMTYKERRRMLEEERKKNELKHQERMRKIREEDRENEIKRKKMQEEEDRKRQLELEE